MEKSKKPSMPPMMVWPEAVPSREENNLFSISIRDHHISWAIHEGVANNLIPTLFWRTPLIEIDDHQQGTMCEILSTYLSDGAKEIIFGSKSADPTPQNAIRASEERDVSLLSVYVVSTNEDQLKTMFQVLSEIPCRVCLLTADDFYTKEQGRWDGMGIDRLANLKAAGEYKGYPALVFDGGTGFDAGTGFDGGSGTATASTSTYTAADENGNIMGGGLGPGVNLQMTSLSSYTYSLPQTTLESVKEELASLTDEDGNVLKTLPVFARTPEENIVTRLCVDISSAGQLVIKHFLNDVGEPKANDDGVKRNTGRVIHVTGEDAPLIARLLEPNCPLIKSLPSTETLPLPKYKVKALKHMVHYGITSVLKEHVKEFEESSTAELDIVLIGQRIAKEFPVVDQDGDYVYRGSVACVHASGSEFPYGIRYDDGYTEDMNALQLYEALGLYIQVGEKESHAGESLGAKINSAKAAASQLATKDKTVEESVAEKKRVQSKTATSGAESSSEAAANTQAAKDETAKNPPATVKKRGRPPKNKTPASGAEPHKQLAKKPNTQAANDETAKNPPATVKKRGRPPKNKTTASGAEPPKQLAKKPSTQAANDETAKNPPATVKKRGRPRKRKTTASGAEPPKQLAKKPKKAPPSLNKADKDYVGDRVAKDFDGEVFFGTCREVWFDDESGEKLWRINYDDSDVEDLGEDGFIKFAGVYEKEKRNDKKGPK